MNIFLLNVILKTNIKKSYMLGSYVARKLLVFVLTLTGTFAVKKYQICLVISCIK